MLKFHAKYARSAWQAGFALKFRSQVAPAGQPRSNYFNIVQGTQSAAYGLIQTGPLAFTTFDANGRPVPYDLAGTCFKTATNTLGGGLNGSCAGTPSDPGNQNDSKQFTQGLYDPLVRGDI